ncbi:ATP-binding cassette domain-containing protein [Phyllobacterium sp. UNC302MFCol5.2]|uniref:ABC transporter ATP-binding protein n=1 Tax=Phyllobacterium sp. UNC302MFCol5.2 TaxID=1449065 RepID=UPI00068C3F8C|nr:ATP-binding cassette domain-containing protein [Phyllobacterium sp. UNC302MFCol5.2]
MSRGQVKKDVPTSLVPTEARDQNAIHLIDLHKRFGPLHVLKGVSLSAKQGDVVAIIGGSGSGKSTMLRCINCLETPTEGKIVIGGEEVHLRRAHQGLVPGDTAQLRRIRSRLAMVFQGFNLWSHMSLLDNVTLAPVSVLGMRRDEAVVRGEQLLDRVGLKDKKDAYPAFLSGGQQQRGAIARALAVDPTVMLFDEPTSALDPELVGEVLKVIGDLAREGRTMLLVTHEMKFARQVATHVVFLHQGVIEEEGPPEAVFGTPRSERLQKFLATVR